MLGTNCLRQPNIPLQGMTYEPVFSLHPEYDLHYPREDKDHNGCVGQAIWDGNAERDPSDVSGTTNSWYLHTPHNDGVAIATPSWLTTAGEAFNEWVLNPRGERRGMVNLCVIRLRGDVSSVPTGTTILTYQQWTGSPGNWAPQFATPPTITEADFPGNSATWFTVRIDNIALDHIAMCEFQWSGQGEIWIDRIDYYTECSFDVTTGVFDINIGTIAAAAQVPVYGNGRIDGFTIADEPWAAMMIPAAYVRNHLAGMTPSYLSKFWLNPSRINEHTTYTMLEVLDAVDINIYPFENGITENADIGAFQEHLQTIDVDLLRDFQGVNGLYYQREVGSTVQTFWNEGDGWRYPTASELELQVNLSLAYGSKSIWYFLLTGEDTYHGILDGDGNIVNTELYDAVRTINMRLTGDWGTSLSALTYREGFSRHEEELGGVPFDLNIAPVDPFGHVRDIVSSPQSGWFEPRCRRRDICGTDALRGCDRSGLPVHPEQTDNP